MTLTSIFAVERKKEKRKGYLNESKVSGSIAKCLVKNQISQRI